MSNKNPDKLKKNKKTAVKRSGKPVIDAKKTPVKKPK